MHGGLEVEAPSITRRRDAIWVCVLSCICGFIGNPLLGFVGTLTGFMVLTSGNGGSAQDLHCMLAFITAVLAGFWLAVMLPVSIVLLGTDPRRVCSVSHALIEQWTPPAVPAVPLGPWNMTETAQGHVYHKVLAPSTLATFKKGVLRLVLALQSTSHHEAVVLLLHADDVCVRCACLGLTDAVEDLLCGPEAPTYVLGLGLLVFCLCLFVILPLMSTSLRLMRAAQRTGGCTDFGGGAHASYQRVIRIPSSSSSGVIRGSGGGVFIPAAKAAQGVPVQQASSVYVAPPGPSSHPVGKAMV
jgi:hypothetical protein